jgi:hypothetical protein
MLSEIDRAGSDGQADLALMEAVWQRIRQSLADEKQRIVQEIRHYPPPIPACDVQFNSLLEERAIILQELAQVDGILKQRLAVEDHIRLLDEFMRSSDYVDDELAEKIRSF